MAISDWPNNERPREKMLEFGARSLSEAELLAIFLRTGTKGQSAIELARSLLKDHKSLKSLLNLPYRKLVAKRGIGLAKYAMLQAALELAKRCQEEHIKHSKVLNSTLDAKSYLISKLANQSREIFACIFLDSKHKILCYEALFSGTINYTPIYPRVIAQKALEYNASAIILAHNHPSGDTEPSQSDILSTRELATILNHLDIKVLDHLIVGGQTCSSLAELGLF